MTAKLLLAKVTNSKWTSLEEASIFRKIRQSQSVHYYFIILFIDCLAWIYVMAFTSGIYDAGSDGQHGIEMLVTGQGSYRRSIAFYDRPENDMYSNKGDLWKIKFSDFKFPFTCIKLSQLHQVSIVAISTDGWNIESIVTLVKDTTGKIQILTQDLDIHRWIDGNGDPSQKRFVLTRAWLWTGFIVHS